MRDENEITDQITKAIRQMGEDAVDGRRYDYLTGVEEALNWVLGITEDAPADI
jgi:hypothetical protein